MKPASAGKERVVWTVARLLKVLSAGVRARGRRALTLEEVRSRYGLGTRDLLELARRLSRVEDFSSAGQLPLQLFLEPGEGKTHFLGSQGAEGLLRLSRLGKADAVVAADALEHLAVEPDAAAFCRALALKLKGAAGGFVTDPYFLYRSSDPPTVLKKVALVKEGLDSRRTLAFEYRGPSSGSAGRVADPLALRRDNGAWRCLGWDHHREAPRTFSVEHMAKIVVTEHAFDWPRGVDLSTVQARDLSVYQPTGKETEVRLRVRSKVASEWRKAFKKVGRPGKDAWRDAVVMASSLEWLVRTFLPMVDEVRVVGPGTARLRWVEEIEFLADRSGGGIP